MRDSLLIQNLHAAISRRDWHAVEAAANAIRDDEHSARRVLAGTDIGGLPHDWSTTQVAEERMKELSTLKAGIRRISDEEEFINETGRDGMLSAVHIGARLAEAEKERDSLKVDASNHAADAESVRRERDALIRERDELRAALEPFAALGDRVLAEAPPEASMLIIMRDCQGDLVQMSLEYFRRARAALKGGA